MNTSKALGVTLLTAALTLGPIAAATAGPPPAAAQATSSTASPLDQSSRQTIIETFDGINAFRASKGLKPLKFNAAISTVSQKWSNRMSATGRFFHNDDYVSGAPAGWDSATENIAWATWAPSGKRFVAMWINSPAHNTNMSRPGDDYIGIGIGSKGGATYATANHFSYRAGVIPPRSYNHPRDYFNGRPALTAESAATVTASAPAFNRATGKYTIPAKAGVTYSVNGKVKKAGTYSVPSGRTPKFTAKATLGYKLSGTPSWTYDFRKAVTPARPAMNSKTNRYTIPANAGVTYLVNGRVKKAGTYGVPNGRTPKFTTKITSSSYRLIGTTAWTFRF